ncbi:MAG: hypothetical protein GX053_15460 [Tissierella sp.]|nr:hypothetical protein [Tissierella sp.]
MKKQLDRIENKLDMLLNLVEDKDQSDNVGIENGKLSDLNKEIVAGYITTDAIKMIGKVIIE